MSDSTTEKLFDDAQEAFPGKEDMKDRLVAIWTTGKHGKRKSEADGKSYDWVETYTLVLDNGPNGDFFTDLVPAAPQLVPLLQWSTGGMTARLLPRIDNDRPMLGRINSQKNRRKGFSDSWSIASPTEKDYAIANSFAALIRETGEKVKAYRNGELAEAAEGDEWAD